MAADPFARPTRGPVPDPETSRVTALRAHNAALAAEGVDGQLLPESAVTDAGLAGPGAGGDHAAEAASAAPPPPGSVEAEAWDTLAAAHAWMMEEVGRGSTPAHVLANLDPQNLAHLRGVVNALRNAHYAAPSPDAPHVLLAMQGALHALTSKSPIAPGAPPQPHAGAAAPRDPAGTGDGAPSSPKLGISQTKWLLLAGAILLMVAGAGTAWGIFAWRRKRASAGTPPPDAPPPATPLPEASPKRPRRAKRQQPARERDPLWDSDDADDAALSLAESVSGLSWTPNRDVASP